MKKTALALLLLVAATCHAQRGAPPNALSTRYYPVLPNLIERTTAVVRDMGLAVPQKPDAGEELKKMFAGLGVPWPEGASIAYLAVIGKLVVINTPENLAIFEQVLAELGVTPRQIQIEAQFVAYDLTNIAKVVAMNGINTASLTALWTNGFGELLMSPVVVTKAGQEAVAKGVTENIYPTRFTLTGLDPTNEMNNFPSDFQTREVGIILQVVPEISPDGQMINLTLNPQIVEDPVWEDYGCTIREGQKDLHMPMKQPFFHVNSVSTSISIYNGQRVLVGGGMPSRDRKRVVYLFVSAKLVDPAGTVSKVRDGDRPTTAK
jgi:type II secretory pathway component GspD/PulD (secretin)